MISIKYENLDDIIQADTNPKDHDLGVLYQSMKRFGFTNPIIINESTGKLLAGHGRLQTIKMMRDNGEKAPDRIEVELDTGDETIEYWHVPVLYGVSIDNLAEAQAYLIADNRLTELGGWKPMDLMENLSEILEETGNLDGTGYDLDDVETILSDIERDTFDVSDTMTEIDDETEVSIAVGRYKFKVDAEDFYQWEEMAQSTTNSKDIVDIAEQVSEITHGVDGIILDLPNHDLAINAVVELLNPGGRIACYCPVTSQVERAWQTCEDNGLVVEWAGELMERKWGRASKGGIRPVNGPFGHTAFLLIAHKR